MALSLSNFLIPCWVLIFIGYVQSATVTYDFNITWVRANPDGAFERPTIGINGQWPLPHITATVGDRVIINVNNHLGNQTASLHFHGLFQNGTTSMDGPVGVSQCAIPSGGSFTYNFTVRLSQRLKEQKRAKHF
jgi:iron transport multicopper oxidase